jgi:hypothetical protein
MLQAMGMSAPQELSRPPQPEQDMGNPLGAGGSEEEKTAVAYVMSAIEMLDYAGQVFPPIQQMIEQLKAAIQQGIAEFLNGGPQIAAPPQQQQPPDMGMGY